MNTREMLKPDNDAEQMCFMPVQELQEGLQNSRFTAREITEVHLSRIDRINPILNAYVTVLHEQALADADASDQRRRAGRTLGVLDGIPVSVKDVEPMAGVRFTMGLRPMANHVSDFDPVHVQTFRSAGAVILGKTNTPEMGHKGTTDNMLFGPTLNPHHLAYNAGGSSGGAAASVAAGLAVIAQGSDGGGSIRIPAAMTGVVGLKSSAFVVPEVRRPNAFQASTPFQTIGVLGRTVEDASIATALLARPNPRDPFSVSLPRRQDPSDNLVIGFDSAFGNFPIASDVHDATSTAMSRIAQLHRVTDISVRLPDHDELAHLWRRLIAVQTAFNAESLAEYGVDLTNEHRGEIPVELAEMIDIGRGMSALEHSRDQVRRTVVFDAIEDALKQCDVIATPCVAVAGVKNGPWGRTVGPSEVNGRTVEPTIGWTLTYPVNLSGHPALSIPIGLTPSGLPIGLQLIGKRWNDHALFAAAATIEQLMH